MGILRQKQSKSLVRQTMNYFSDSCGDKLELAKIALYQIRRFIKLQAPSSVSIIILKLRVRNPKTFNTKILYKIANERSLTLNKFADKIAVRDYVAESIGPEFLTKIYGVFHHAHTVNLSGIPRNFVLKPNHVSGAALVVADFFSKSVKEVDFSRRILSKYYINPQDIVEAKIRELSDFWLGTNYYGYHRTAYPEWAYKDIPPCVYIEELLSSDNQPPEDFRFFMFEGKCQVIMVDTPGFLGVRRDVYTPEWELLNVAFGHPNSYFQRERPKELTEMIEIAQKLSKNVDHLRVDLYNLSGRVVFSELTNYHAGGTQKFNPRSFDLELGASWNPKKHY
jgi:hypothetical protein